MWSGTSSEWSNSLDGIQVPKSKLPLKLFSVTHRMLVSFPLLVSPTQPSPFHFNSKSVFYMHFSGPYWICIFNHKKHAHKSEMLAFGDVCGDYRLMKHSHEGISTSGRMPGEMLGSYKTICVRVIFSWTCTVSTQYKCNPTLMESVWSLQWLESGTAYFPIWYLFLNHRDIA